MDRKAEERTSRGKVAEVTRATMFQNGDYDEDYNATAKNNRNSFKSKRTISFNNFVGFLTK